MNCRELWGINKKQRANGFIKREGEERGPPSGQCPRLVTEPGPQVHPEDVVSLNSRRGCLWALAEARRGSGARL